MAKTDVTSGALSVSKMSSMKENSMTDTAIIVVDVQNDFCEGGALPVTGGLAVADRIYQFLRELTEEEETEDIRLIATKDWHVDPGDHFSDTPDYVNSWPPHCIAGTSGADFAPALSDFPFDEIFYKGQTSASYSGFEGLSHKYANGKTLDEYLKDEGIVYVFVVGLALDYCVAATARDAARLGYKTNILRGLTAPVSEDNVESLIEELMNYNIYVY